MSMNLDNAFALLVGVGGADIPITIDDAEAIGNVLIDANKAGYKKENVFVLTGKDSTRTNVLKYLKKINDSIVKKEDSTVIIYYSGHGGLYNDNGKDEFYLLTHGFDTMDRANTMVNGEEFSTLVNEIDAKKILVMLDCCHASGMLETKALYKVKSPDVEIVNSNIELLRMLGTGEGRVYITSCDDDEQSVILPDSRYSLFTEVVLEAFNGYATQEEPYVSMIDLLYHVLNEVPKRVKKYNHVQRPIINKIEFLSPDYYICKASHENNRRNRIDDLKDNESEINELFEIHNLRNSHQAIPLNQESTKLNAVDQMLKTEIISKVEGLIARGNTDRAIQEFLDGANNAFTDYRTQSITLAAQYNTLINEKMIGIIDDGTYRTQLARITHSLQFFLTKVRDDLIKDTLQ